MPQTCRYNDENWRSLQMANKYWKFKFNVFISFVFVCCFEGQRRIWIEQKLRTRSQNLTNKTKNMKIDGSEIE